MEGRLRRLDRWESWLLLGWGLPAPQVSKKLGFWELLPGSWHHKLRASEHQNTRLLSPL